MSSQTMGILAIAAAASLLDVLPLLCEAYNKDNPPITCKSTFDASSRLAKQLQAGAPFDVLMTADDLDVKLNNKRVFAGNTLVMIVPASARTHWLTLAELAKTPPNKLALAGENVPAGKYADAALKAAGVFDELKPRIVRAEHVRAAVKWVATGEAGAGIVYLSDTLGDARVKLAFLVASGPIHYVAGAVPASKKQELAARFLDFLQTEPSRAILVRNGFSRP